jgi:hypothetical protein
MASYLNYKVTGILSNKPYRTYMLARYNSVCLGE